MSKRQLVEVRWVDSTSPGTWFSKPSFKSYRPDDIRSIGFLMHEGPDHITIGCHEGSEMVDGVMCIPKCAIKSRKVIKR